MIRRPGDRKMERAATCAARFEGSRCLADVIMAPTRIYAKPLLALMRALPVKGLAHITGGGLLENVPRILGESLKAVMRRASWPRPPLFDWLQREGSVTDAEMHRVFNCGIGMVAVVAPEHADAALGMLADAGETAYPIGEIGKGNREVIII